MISEAKSSLAQEEYDFSEVPEDELESCLYYEYLRESEAIIREVENVAHQIKDDVKRHNYKVGDLITMKLTFTKVTNYDGGLFEGVIIYTLAGSPAFPKTPWQKLSTSDKERLRNFRDRASKAHKNRVLSKYPRLLLDTFLEDPTRGEMTLNAWKALRTPKPFKSLPALDLEKTVVSGFFQISMGYKPDMLVDAFRDWMKVNHPKGSERPKERRGRDSERDPLNALGALRLRFHCRTLNEAQKLIAPLASKPNGIHYSDRTAWKRACDSAVKHFRLLLQLSDGHLPTHFTKGWRK